MSYAEERSSGNKTVLIVLGILGGTFLVGMLLCAGIGFLVFSSVKPIVNKVQEIVADTQSSTELAQEFLEELRSDQLDEAYQLTSAEFRARTTAKQFDDLVHDHPAIRQTTSIDRENMSLTGQNLEIRHFKYTFRGTEGKAVEVTLKVIKQGDDMKVDDAKFREIAVPDTKRLPSTDKTQRGEPKKP